MEFRAYPNPRHRGGLYYRVIVFSTARELRARARAEGVAGVSHAQGLCHTYTLWRPTTRGGRTKPEAGMILLHRRGLSVNYVSHEVAHAAFEWLRRKGLNPNRRTKDDLRRASVGKAEEDACYVVGNLCTQIYARLYASGIISPGPGKKR
jgi:hypothetical protein